MIVIFSTCILNQPREKNTSENIHFFCGFFFCCEILLYALTFPIATHTFSDDHVIMSMEVYKASKIFRINYNVNKV